MNVLEIVVRYQVDEHIEDDTLYRTNIDPTIVERPVVDSMSSFPRGFDEMDAMFLEFAKYLDSFMGGSSLVGDNSGTSQPSVTLTPRRRAQSRPLELEYYVVANGQILMTITLGTVKPIFPHVICFSQTIDVCARKTFSIRYLKWVYVGREYIEVVKGDLQRFFVLDFNDQAMNRFVVHQMLNTFKEFWVDRHRHFTKYSDPEKARADPLYLLVGRDED
ncbi:CACTA en-spm transposon protein [Cucumis melo var. makuwa]|uniref:CACTA en-spm transposon protein n=1 Tax=Cucumis melo var. makuwa TaxID=1194695 RepID=A0A5A7TUW6_CUCMM|nr:CACTA en-spm transposon protein [Cucumis melo var. makuwa]